MSPDEDAAYCPHTLEDPAAMRGGVRQYPEGLQGWIGFRDTYGELVSVGCEDRVAFAAALRRVADEVESGSNELPPVALTGEQFLQIVAGERVTRICEDCNEQMSVRKGDLSVTCPPCDYEAIRLRQAAG